MNTNKLKRLIEPLIFLTIFFCVFGVIGNRMGLSNMLNTIMQTSYRLLLDTVFFLMGITVLSGALGKLLVEFGVVRMLEKILRPLMKPLFGLPGVAALGAVLTFLSDNPAIIALAKDKQFGQYFKKYQLISLTNFGTAFGMGLIVVVYMTSLGFGKGALVGLFGAVVGSIVSTRLMQRFTLKSHPEYLNLPAYEKQVEVDEDECHKKESTFIRALNAILDGGKSGVDLGLAIIPGVLVISTAVMMMTFGPSGEDGQYMGVAYEGVPVLPYLADKINVLFDWLFGFQFPELVSFPITALGAVGAALGLLPEFIARGFVDNNVIAVFTAIGMCWSGYLSTHTAMLDSLGYRRLTGKAIGAHTIGGLCAGIVAHWAFVLLSLI
ncbi:MAG: nucleoside recognition domain-containing protein [Paludibacteraceae bacterium]|nr:nucleoside recognition domain-containing protein [Paludibacteraceae bacterium]